MRPAEFEVLVNAWDVCSSETKGLLIELVEREKPAHTRWRLTELAPAGFVVGRASVVGQSVAPGYAPEDETTFGLALGNGPPRPRPIGLGFALGHDSRLPGAPPHPLARHAPDARVGRTRIT
ncbi:MAG: hypothetical protein KF901_32550 [Myxococcales bacterium]|nr:hypothetical protein [Myxococcales bacterium]